MQAITTKHQGPTDTRGARISAQAAAGRVSIPYPHELNTEEGHRAAATALCDKFGWRGQLVTGQTHKGDFVHVFMKEAA